MKVGGRHDLDQRARSTRDSGGSRMVSVGRPTISQSTAQTSSDATIGTR